MGLISSLYAGISGLNANSLDLSVIGDNIANANTIGFKGNRAAFEDALAQSVLNGQIGTGTQLQSVQRVLQQGSLMSTGNATDLAIDGNGFFVVKGNHAGQEGNYYTRAGQFTVDANGYLVNLDGLKVQGYSGDSQGNIQALLGDLQVGSASSEPNATEKITIKANLSPTSDTAVDGSTLDPNATPWDSTRPDATANFKTSTTVYDSLGASHTVDVYYRKSAAGSWEWHAMADVNGTKTEIGTGALTFDGAGKLTSGSPASIDLNGQAIALNFGSNDPNGATDGITQFAAEKSSLSFVNQDGYASGTLSSISVDAEGKIIGAFSNGQTRPLGQVALANFSAADKMTRIGGNLYGQTPDSGDPAIGTAGSGGRGQVAAGTLEQSNVDMASEFVRMIAAQRGFQANSKTISTADQLLQELMNLKR